MSEFVVSIHAARPVSEDALIVPVRERAVLPRGGNRAAIVEIGASPGSEGVSFLPARRPAAAEDVYPAPTPVENLAELAPLHLPYPVPAPPYAPATAPVAYPDYHYRQAREAYEAASRLDRPGKLLSISV